MCKKNSIHRKIAAAACLCFYLITPLPSNETDPAVPANVPEIVAPAFAWLQETNTAFSPGEVLQFNVRWQFLTVGSASMEIDSIVDFNGRKAYHIVTKASSAPFFDTFFKVRDTNEAWMDTESLSSLKFSSHISEGNYKKDETIIIDQQNRKFTITESGKTGNTPAWVKDVLSSMYYLRTRDLAVGKEYSIDAHSGDKSWPLIVNVTGREKVKTAAGNFTCWVVEPALRDGAGIFKADGKLKVWLTCDEKKLPVLMRSKVKVGAIEARLVEVKFND
ncbi:MAG: hypothetical protein A2219_01865 [Elusimicrobia bacterium RIFOXYA2_FULL_50_26]|nr:MAG: hypothetical protein A2219_01865 [Elusimicrobia bacterium RIFOXYA2_FULL_50_26]OGS24006.1 MAG: hypothetical protein A2314_02485 [Elusimicrobia bacterium RIFOXYB2_FULL_50_12]